MIFFRENVRNANGRCSALWPIPANISNLLFFIHNSQSALILKKKKTLIFRLKFRTQIDFPLQLKTTFPNPKGRLAIDRPKEISFLQCHLHAIIFYVIERNSTTN